MTQSDVLTKVAELVSTATGKDYTVDYAPMRNLSEQTMKTQRVVSPGNMRKEAVHRGASVVTYQEVRIILFGAVTQTNSMSYIQECQEELSGLLDSAVNRMDPMSFSIDGEDAVAKAGECRPMADSGLMLSELEETGQQIVSGCVTLTFMIC